MKDRELSKTTTDSRTYKLLQKRILYKDEGLCWYCGLHSGCNSSSMNRNNNWKRYRKVQYKLK
jgi:hypothetical protein